MDEYNEIIKRMEDIEGIRLFFHFTESNCEEIINNGLFLEQKEWYTTLLEISLQEKEDLNGFITSHVNKHAILNWQKFLVIVAVPIECGYNFVENVNELENGSDFSYVIPNKYILCYIDLATHEVVYNEESICYEEYIIDNYYFGK